MTFRRATLYIGGAALLVSWFSSAASVSLNRNVARGQTVIDETGSPVEALASDVERQSKRLRERLASAPVPVEPLRNPFTFRKVTPNPQASPVRRLAVPAALPATAEPHEPPLILIGLAEQARPQGLVRTALISTEGEQLIMAIVGDRVLDRYTVTAISVDAVELTEASTGRTRRLALQF